ncbi:MAG: penicillin acylase family protein, partial [Chloroflexota bacterium]
MARRLGRLVARLLVVVLVLLLVVAVALVGLVGSILGRAMPETSGTIRLPGLSGPVDILRDANGIVQIYADIPEDLFAAQGWVHASERMWQMELWRRIGAGRLSELFGKTTVATDRFVRTLGWRQAAARDLEAFSPDVRAALDAYARGVNAWLEGHRDRLGIEFVVAGLLTGKGGLGGVPPEPWTPLDSATWQKVQAWNLGGNFESELFRWLADARLGDPARTDSLFPPYPADAP